MYVRRMNLSLTTTAAETAEKTYRRGEIYFADFGDTPGASINKIRPALIISNNRGNAHSPTVIVVALSSKYKKMNLPTHILMESNTGLKRRGIVMTEQVKTLDKTSLLEKCGQVSEAFLERVNRAVAISMGLDQKYNEL